MRSPDILILGVLLLLFSCKDPQDLKHERFISHGLVLYQEHCGRCHGGDGKGLGTLYPPLLNSDYLVENQDSLACMIRKGKVGEIMVNGIMYNQPMPGNEELLEEEIAQIINYVNTAWGDDKSFYSTVKVEKNLKNCY